MDDPLVIFPAAAGSADAEPAFVADQENPLTEALLADVVAAEPRYNPLALYGPAGCGKSLLLRRLVEAWTAARPGKRSWIADAEAFRRQFVRSPAGSARRREAPPRPEDVDLFVLDGLDDLADRPLANRALARWIEKAVALGKLVWVAGRLHPLQTPGLSPALVGRLAAGLVVPLHLPGRAARMEIVRRLSGSMRLPLSTEVVEQVADRIVGSGAALRTACLALAAAGHGSTAPLDRAVVAAVLDAIEGPAPDVRAIARCTAQYFRLPAAELRGPSRRQAASQARGVALYLAKQLTGLSYRRLGAEFGGRDHATVLHACRKTAEALPHDLQLQRAVDDLLRELRGRAAPPPPRPAGSKSAGAAKRRRRATEAASP